MVRVIKSKSGDTFDSICYGQLGSSKYLGELLKANPDLLNIFIFPANVSVVIPDVEENTTGNIRLPAWFS